MEKLRVCRHCNQSFNMKGKVFANHVRWCPENKTNGDKGASKIGIAIKKAEAQRHGGDFLEFKVLCFVCSNEVTIVEREHKHPVKPKYYCNRSCANKRVHSKDTKDKMSVASSRTWLSEEYRQKQADNNVSNNKRFSSKSEVEVRDHFKSKFPEDCWTFGGALRCEDLYITRDLYSPSLKVCIEYDGIWHFKDIHGQLEDKQAKDKALELWCIKNDWRLIRIKDEIYLNNKLGVLKELEYFAYYSQETITKLY